MSDRALLLAAATLLFLLVHALFERGARLTFSAAFRLGRGLASLLLTALGFFALVRFRALWRTVFLLETPSPLATMLVLIPIGHFAADFLLVIYGRLREGAPPRKDLLVHHALGLFAAGLTLAYPIAAPLYLLLFTAELMPITTALAALGALRGSPSLERLGARLRLWVLLGWRIPLWLCVGLLIARAAARGELAGDARIVCAFSSLFLLVTLSLDAFWTAASLRALRASERH